MYSKTYIYRAYIYTAPSFSGAIYFPLNTGYMCKLMIVLIIFNVPLKFTVPLKFNVPFSILPRGTVNRGFTVHTVAGRLSYYEYTNYGMH